MWAFSREFRNYFGVELKFDAIATLSLFVFGDVLLIIIKDGLLL